jgi:hypothetical protein
VFHGEGLVRYDHGIATIVVASLIDGHHALHGFLGGVLIVDVLEACGELMEAVFCLD